ILEAVCLKAMARRPENRFACMADFAAALNIVESPAPRHAPATVHLVADSRMAGKILDLLRNNGWARGVHQIRLRAERTEGGERAVWQGFLDWMAGERTTESALAGSMQALPEGKALRGWALVGRSSFLMRQRDFREAGRTLDKAETQGDDSDAAPPATPAPTPPPPL